MNWQFYALIATLGATIYILFVKILSNFYEVTSLLTILFFLSFLFFYLILPLFDKNISYSKILNISNYIEKFSVLSGIIFAIAQKFATLAIKNSPNPGIPTTLVSGSVGITYLLSFFLFNEKFDLQKLIGLLFIGLAIFIEVGKDILKSNNKNNSSIWILYTLIATISISFVDITGKLSFQIGKLKTYENNVVINLISFLSLAIMQILSTHNIGLQKIKKPKKEKISKINIFNKKPILALIIAFLSLILFRYNLVKSIFLSPNPTFPRVIFNGSFILTLLLSLLIIEDSKITQRNIIAAILMLIGIIKISLTK